MRLLKFLILLSLTFYLPTGISNASGTISGIVIDPETKQVALGVSVSLSGVDEIIKTGKTGSFKFTNLQNKYYSLTFESLGCKKLIVDSVLANPDSSYLYLATYYLEGDNKEIKVIKVISDLKRSEILNRSGPSTNVIIGREKLVDTVTAKKTIILDNVIKVEAKQGRNFIHSRIPNIAIVNVFVLC